MSVQAECCSDVGRSDDDELEPGPAEADVREGTIPVVLQPFEDDDRCVGFEALEPVDRLDLSRYLRDDTGESIGTEPLNSRQWFEFTLTTLPVS